MKKLQEDPVVSELEDIKKLLILQLFDKGYSQSQLAQVLGVSQPTISRMFPKGAPVPKGKGNNG